MVISSGAPIGLVAGTYRLFGRIEVSSRGLKRMTPFGSASIAFDEIEQWSTEHGPDYGKSVWNRNPVGLPNEQTLIVFVRGDSKKRRVRDFEVTAPGWPSFVETIRGSIPEKEAKSQSLTAPSSAIPSTS